MSDIFRDIIRATCGNQSQQIKDYIYQSMVEIYDSCKEKKEDKKRER